MKRSRLYAGLIAFVLAVALLGYPYLADRSTPAGQPPLAEMTPQVFEQFKQDFNRAAGTVRIVALLSPT